MATLADVKRAVRKGNVYDATNHYIKRKSHPCFGTIRRTVTEVNTKAFYLSYAQKDGMTFVGRIPWPPASQVEMSADGVIRFYGLGYGQADSSLFLTLVPVPTEKA